MLKPAKRFSTHQTNHLGRRLSVALVLIALVGWAAEGDRILARINPALTHELAVAMHPPLDVWIAPPEMAGQSPIIISTPAGVRFEDQILVVPEGSSISAHLAEQDGDRPELLIDGDSTPFSVDAHGDFTTVAALAGAQVAGTHHNLAIRRGWVTLASWKIDIVPDHAPTVALVEKPTMTEGKAVRLSYMAQDAFGLRDIALRITPHDAQPGANNHPVDIALPTASSKQVARVDFQDLTAWPWAGQTVAMQIVATNQAGKRALSEPVEFTLPERRFFHPLARVLIEERKKLLQKPDDEALRDEIANVMAGIAQEIRTTHGDPVIMMTLRAGAVRLVLDRAHDAALSVNDMLWQSAMRIEDGTHGQAERMLRDARQDLSFAIKRNAGPEEITWFSQQVQQALVHYMDWIHTRKTPAPVQPSRVGSGHASPKAQVRAADTGY